MATVEAGGRQRLVDLLREVELLERQLVLMGDDPTETVIASFRLRIDSLDQRIRHRADELGIDVGPLLDLRQAWGACLTTRTREPGGHSDRKFIMT